MRTRYIALAIIAALWATQANAATKAEVAAAGCMTLEKARSKHPTAHLMYRLIDDAKCWYNPTSFGTAVVKRTIKVTPQLEAKPVKGDISTDTVREQAFDDELDSVFMTLCGGPCPQLSRQPSWVKPYSTPTLK